MAGRPGISQKRLSLHRFHQIPEMSFSNNENNDMANPNDVTIDIPLTDIISASQTGARKLNSNSNSNNGPVSPSPSGYNHLPVDQSGNEKTTTTTTPEGLHQPGPGRRRRRTIDESTGKSLEDPEDGTLNRMGRLYQTILNFSIVTRYMIYVTPLAVLIAIPIIVGAAAAQHARIGGVPICWFFTWFEVVWLSLWVSKIFAHYLPFLFQFLCGIVSSGTRKYALILRALELPLATVVWCIISLVTFLPVSFFFFFYIFFLALTFTSAN